MTGTRARWARALRLLVVASAMLGVAPTSPARAAPLGPVVQRSGSLRRLVRHTRKMRRVSRSYRAPSATELRLARRAFRQLLAGRLASARPGLSLLGFELFTLHDKGRRYHVVRELPSRPVTGWGLFVLDPAPRRRLVLQAPHARHDWRTGSQAADLMARLGGRALLLSTAYRCASPLRSRCSGRTSACSRDRRTPAPYRLSDLAHTARSVFQVVHELLVAERQGANHVVQLHGFARRPGRKLHVIISDGTDQQRPASWASNRLADAVRDELARRHRHGVVSCNERPGTPLCGTENVQGRQVNGAADPCLQEAPRGSGRFFHVEQSRVARRRRARYYEALAYGLKAALPLAPRSTGQR